MKIKTKEVLKYLNGKSIESDVGDLTVGIALSEILVSSRTGGKMKSFLLAQKLVIQEEVEIDPADLAVIKKEVETTERYINLVTGQVLVYLESLKEEKK